MPTGGTVRQLVAAGAGLIAIVVSCVGFALVVENSRHCHELSKMACLSLMVDNAKSPPERSPDD